MIVDTHCHLDLRQFDEDREAVIERAAAAGRDPADQPGDRPGLVPPGAGPGRPLSGTSMRRSACIRTTAPTSTTRRLAHLRDLAQHPKVVAIGEIGLDYYWERVDHEQQKRALRAQLGLAAELKPARDPAYTQREGRRRGVHGRPSVSIYHNGCLRYGFFGRKMVS